MRKGLLTSGAVVALLLLCCVWLGCHAPRYNEAIGAAGVPSVGDPAAVVQDDDTLVFVALSGGGTRAAAMSWSVLERLREITYTFTGPDGQPVRTTLADQIDYISGISGGSFAATGWCLFKDRPDGMAAFRERFVERNIQGALAKNLFWPPWRLGQLLSSEYDRIHVAAELYDREVFDGKTFGDLPPHPVLWVNATNLSLGDRFTFTQEQFDHIGSDLSAYPVGFACAASSAFPVLLSPITLLNHGDPADLESEAAYRMAKLNAARHIEQDFYVRMRDFYNDKANAYIHLADGGLVDNQGLQAILDEFETNGVINKRLNDRDAPMQRLVIINVNAGTVGEDTASQDIDAPGVAGVLGYTTVLSMDLLSAKRWAEIKGRADDIGKSLQSFEDLPESWSRLEKPFAIEINFRNIADAGLKSEAWGLPTSFALDAEQLATIDAAVESLMAEGSNRELDRLVESLQGGG